MSDLISRSELIMRLSDYALQESPNDNESTGEQRISKMIYDAIQNCISCVEEQPTAYSVEKVVEELEELKMRYFLTIANTGDEKSDFAYENVGNALDKAIEIVKHGSVVDDVCEWKQASTARYKTSCGYKVEEYFDTNACYCKQCGKKIKIVGGGIDEI